MTRIVEHVTPAEMHLDGMVVDFAPVIWRDPARFEPPTQAELMVVIEDPSWPEHLVDWMEWTGSGWVHVGADSERHRLPRKASVRLWAAPPRPPQLARRVLPRVAA